MHLLVLWTGLTGSFDKDNLKEFLYRIFTNPVGIQDSKSPSVASSSLLCHRLEASSKLELVSTMMDRLAIGCTLGNWITILPTGVLQIYDVGQRDAGNYRCVATTVAHRRKSMEASLMVNPAKESESFHTPTIIAGPQNMTASLHQTIVLECMATGNPKPIISWSRLDHKSIDVFNTRVLGNGNLMISDVRLQHAGVYVCRATTPGTRNFTVAMATLTVLGLNNEEYQVVIGNDTTHYIIDDLEPASNYTFYIVAYMPMGASQMSDHVTQHTLEDAKYRRGQVVLYRLSFRLSSETSVHMLELPGTTHEYLLEGLKPDSVYLVRITAATRVGLGESSVWTSHRTPKATSVKAPKSPELHLEPLNCTTISVTWQRDARDTAAIQGYKLYYKEEGQQEHGPIFLDTSDLLYTLGGLGE
ncbi:Protogenin [Tupaia chinensis]|uniref:Protogenin n=1 Tax=Tupaia chinensis TaxID=246437 RepID=L8YDL1_TUPCH|nr:Protogenin [Tupaia chinensis]